MMGRLTVLSSAPDLEILTAGPQHADGLFSLLTVQWEAENENRPAHEWRLSIYWMVLDVLIAASALLYTT